ncbi:Protein RarD [Paraconexibacter sp. AEG42_29]|uniref:Protein RarD n=1 Tax=Paraconexibacter sp. AEG42_29 TaxID=2997339 RepID=A0AAU7AXT6_9ACTN
MRAGVLYGLGAYSLWGLFPLYFPLLEPAGSVEVLAHRIVWSLVFVLGVLALTRRLTELRAVAGDRRRLLLLAGSSVLIATNWGIYIYAVSSNHVIEAALGYFVNPLVSVAFGVLVFGERLRTLQVTALALGTVAVIVLTAYSGGFPWISLVLAASFGTYGLLKKLADVGASEGLAVETLVLVVPAAGYLLALGASGDGTFTNEGAGHLALLAAAGPVTAIPLTLFAACVTRVPLSTVGLLQYLTPVLQFLIGWLVQGEAMPTSRWVGFALVWSALVLLTWDALRSASAARAPVLHPEAA